MMRAIVLIVFLSLFFSCTQTKKDSDFMLYLDLVMKQDDSIHIFYKKDGTINFNEKEAFWVKVDGENKNQKLVVAFPDKIVPNQVRIDFGRNKAQEDIVLNKIEFSYEGNSFEAKGKEVYKYFWADTSYTVLDKDFGLLKRKVKGQLNGPSLYPNGYYLAVKLDELRYKSTK